MKASVASIAVLATTATLTSARPGIVQVDLIFPRNETYQTTPLLPVVFSFRDATNASADMGGLSIDWSLVPLDGTVDLATLVDDTDPDSGSDDDNDDIDKIASGNLVPDGGNRTLGPHLWDVVVHLARREARWALSWSLVAGNCTATVSEDDDDDDDGGGGAGDAQETTVVFTTRGNATGFDLVPGDCARDVQSFRLNITADAGRQVGGGGGGGAGRSCGFAPATGPPPANLEPCGARLSKKDASSIMAAATKVACHERNPAVTCAPGSVGAVVVADRGVLLLAAAAVSASFMIVL